MSDVSESKLRQVTKICEDKMSWQEQKLTQIENEI